MYFSLSALQILILYYITVLYIFVHYYSVYKQNNLHLKIVNDLHGICASQSTLQMYALIV